MALMETIEAKLTYVTVGETGLRHGLGNLVRILRSAEYLLFQGFQCTYRPLDVDLYKD